LDGYGLSIREKDVVIHVSTLGLSYGFVRGKLAVSPDGRHLVSGDDDGTLACGIQHAWATAGLVK
jgi:hypothetical protein